MKQSAAFHFYQRCLQETIGGFFYPYVYLFLYFFHHGLKKLKLRLAALYTSDVACWKICEQTKNWN